MTNVSRETWDTIFGKRDPLPAGRNQLFRCTVCNHYTLPGPISRVNDDGERTTCCWDCNADGRLPEYFGHRRVLPPDPLPIHEDINRSIEISGCYIPLKGVK